MVHSGSSFLIRQLMHPPGWVYKYHLAQHLKSCTPVVRYLLKSSEGVKVIFRMAYFPLQAYRRRCVSKAKLQIMHFSMTVQALFMGGSMFCEWSSGQAIHFYRRKHIKWGNHIKCILVVIELVR